MSAKRLLKFLLPPRWRRKLRELVVPMYVTHNCGPKTIRLSSNEAVVTCMVKNGEYYIESFIEHHTQIGFRHIFLLDNGSTDKTISLAKRHKNVSIYETKLSIEVYQALLKRYLALKCVVGGWCLDTDVDELFDYPFSDVVGLQEFLGYLNKKQYTAVICQLLDMISDKPLSHLMKTEQENLQAVYRYYDISAVKKADYRLSEIASKFGQKNVVANPNIAIYSGGIRKTLYGNDCLLTTHSLFRLGKNLELFPNIHFVNNARLADVSCVNRHYKLVSNARATALQNKVAHPTLKGYNDLITLLMKKPDYLIKQSTAVEFRSVNDLVENDFLCVSDDYRELARSLAR